MRNFVKLRQIELNEASLRLSWLALCCMIFVVYIHVGTLYNFKGDLAVVLNLIVARTLAMAAVPIFFAISGFLLVKKSLQSSTFCIVVKNRAYSLLIPYVCWSVVYWACFKIHDGLDIVRLFGLDITTIPMYGVLWYIRLLFVLVLLSPLLRHFVRRFGALAVIGVYSIAVLVKFWCGSNIDRLVFVNNGISPLGISFFLAGIWIAEKGVPVVRRKIAWHSLLALVVILTSTVVIVNDQTIASGVRFLSIPFIALCMAVGPVPFKVPTWVSRALIGVYLLHSILLKAFAKVVPSLNAFEYVMVGAAAFILSLSVACGMRKWLPWCRTLFLGGR